MRKFAPTRILFAKPIKCRRPFGFRDSYYTSQRRIVATNGVDCVNRGMQRLLHVLVAVDRNLWALRLGQWES